MKPIAKTDLWQVPHMQYSVSGHLHVLMANGSEFEIGPGNEAVIPPRRDACVVGDEPYVAVDWSGLASFAKQ